MFHYPEVSPLCFGPPCCLLTYPCLIRSLRVFESDRGAVALCLERAIDNRVVVGSNPTEAVGNFGNFQNPTLPVSFGRDTTNRLVPSIRGLCQGK